VTTGEAQGVMAIWNDIRDGRASDFEHWYRNEHFPERLAVPGFRIGRRFEAVSGTPRYFCYYLTDTPEVLASSAYIERLNHPTPLTRTMMSEVFLNMNRTVCRRIRHFGTLSGDVCVTARFQQPADPAAVWPMLEGFARTEGIAGCELWSAVEQQTDTAAEERLRGGDRKIAACAMVETLRLSDAGLIRDELERAFGATAEIGIYRLLNQLASSELRR
jgi:hypothetical protein